MKEKQKLIFKKKKKSFHRLMFNHMKAFQNIFFYIPFVSKNEINIKINRIYLLISFLGLNKRLFKGFTVSAFFALYWQKGLKPNCIS